MLVLNRHVHTSQRPESILIGDDVEIQIVAVRGQIVRVGIQAPPHIKIARSELLERSSTPLSEAEEISPPTVAEAACDA